MKVSIITDGNNKLGLGHVYQSLSLADALKKKLPLNLSINFLTKSDEIICDFIHSFGYDIKRFDNDNLIFENLWVNKPDRVIFDKLDVSPNLAKEIKNELNLKLIIFTNLTDANQYADVTVIADIGSNFKNIIKKDNSSGKIEFVGPKFWLLRPEFYALKEKSKIHKDVVKDIMLIFGGSDPSNVSSHVLDELLKMNSEFNIILVIGASFVHHSELEKVIQNNLKSKSRVNVVKNMKNVGEVMHKSDVVFASPGLSFFEALAVGTPVLGFHQNELQRQVYADILPTMDISEIYKLPSIIKNKSFLFPDSPLIKSMAIGEGKDEIINEILN